MNYLENFEFWYKSNLTDDEKVELDAIKDNHEDLKSRFGSELQFGTAGMRGIMGIGTIGSLS